MPVDPIELRALADRLLTIDFVPDECSRFANPQRCESLGGLGVIGCELNSSTGSDEPTGPHVVGYTVVSDADPAQISVDDSPGESRSLIGAPACLGEDMGARDHPRALGIDDDEVGISSDVEGSLRQPVLLGGSGGVETHYVAHGDMTRECGIYEERQSRV